MRVAVPEPFGCSGESGDGAKRKVFAEAGNRLKSGGNPGGKAASNSNCTSSMATGNP